jgi:UDP-glucuronate 4-epimerase
MAVFKFVDAIMGGRPIELYNWGRLRRDFTFVDDTIEGIMRVLPLPPAGDKTEGPSARAPMRLCNIGNQRPVELIHLLRTIESCLGRTANIRLMPMQPGDVYQTQARVDKLKQVTGFVPVIPIEDGIRRFVHWYLGEYLSLGLIDSPHLSTPLPLTYQDVVSAAVEG